MANNNLRTLETLFTKSIGDNELKKIIIPKIQRSYAQGRKEEIQVREGILQELFSVLKEGKDIELNFIYGSLKEKGTYELLDGQQRITTLFLLYLYVYLQENEALPLWFKDCLTYETRNSSRDFIGELCKLNKLTDDVYLLPSTYIKNQKWYSNAFHLDPTVEAMLVMLDAIDKYYKEAGEQIAEKLKHIRFYALNLNDFNLTEELYIKMNARGLPLTPFENFKADLVGYYKPVKDATEKEFKSWLDFATKLDTEWIDIFWNKESSDKDVDNQYFRFFYRVATILTIIFSKENSDSFNFFRQESEIQTDDKARYLGFGHYKVLFDTLGKDKSREMLTLLLDTFKSYPTIFEEAKAAWGEQITPFADVKNYSQKNAVVFAGIVLYILTQKTSPKENTDFKHWMRVVWNTVENTDINGVVPQVGTIRVLYNLISESQGDIYNHLAQQEKGATNAIDEEIRKAKLIVQDNRFEEVLQKQEGHEFFKGFAGVILSEGVSYECLKNRVERIAPLFDKTGISPEYRNEEHLLIRACITSFREDINKLTNNIFITERVEDDSRLKKFLRENTVTTFIQSILDKEEEILKHLRNIIEKFKLPDDLYKQNYAYERLVKEAKLFEWIKDHTYNNKDVYFKSGYSAETWTYYLHFPGRRYDYLYLNNKRGKIIPKFREKGYDFNDTNDGNNQRKAIEKYNDCFGYWSIELSKTVSFYKIILSFNIDNKLTVFIPDLLVDENLLALFDQPNPENKNIVKVLDLDNDEATILSAIEEIENKVNSL
jgi:hypothetical protein